jgi:hypothetical protein
MAEANLYCRRQSLILGSKVVGWKQRWIDGAEICLVIGFKSKVSELFRDNSVRP